MSEESKAFPARAFVPPGPAPKRRQLWSGRTPAVAGLIQTVMLAAVPRILIALHRQATIRCRQANPQPVPGPTGIAGAPGDGTRLTAEETPVDHRIVVLGALVEQLLDEFRLRLGRRIVGRSVGWGSIQVAVRS